MQQYINIPNKPRAPTAEDERRWLHSSMRRRMIEGTFETDLEDEMLRHFDQGRFLAIGPPDMSSNVLEQICRQLSNLYTSPPTILHQEDISALTSADGLLPKSGLYALLQRLQVLTLALRECFIRIDIVPDAVQQLMLPKLQYRIVTPDYVYVLCADDAPDIPIYYQELRLREDPRDGAAKYVADIFDIRDPQKPRFAMHEVQQDGTLGEDVTKIYTGHAAKTGAEYPYFSAEGQPFLPVEVYRAQKTGKMWNAFDGSTLAYGSLVSSCLMSWWVHCVRDCSYPQRYIAGLGVTGLEQRDGNEVGRRATISTDPSSILMFYQDPDTNGQPLVGQFQAGADPQKMLESISMYEYRVCVSAGLTTGSAIRTSGDPRSGYSLSVSREGMREASRTFSNVFRLHDLSLISKTAMMCNRFLGTSLPEEGYRIQYTRLPLSNEEMKEQRTDIIEKLGAGLISPVQAMQMMHPDLDDEGARQMLLKIKRERAEYM